MLKTTLAPFNDIEDIAAKLGIPFESRDNGSNVTPTTHISSGHTATHTAIKSSAASLQSDGMTSANLDPRSPEFQELLTRIAASFLFLRNHKEIRDSDKYLAWLEKLQNRATSLVAKAIRELLEKASKSCQEIQQQKLYSKHNNANNSTATTNNVGKKTNSSGEDMPVESAAIYQKFRGLSFRVRELTLLLRKGDIASAAAVRAVHDGKKQSPVSILHDFIFLSTS